MRLRLALPCALLLLLPGCAALLDPPRETQTPAPPGPHEDAPAPLALAPSPPPAAPALPAALDFPEVWLWPLQDQTARLDAPGATRVAWFVGIDGVHPDVRFVRGRPYVTAQPGKADAHPVALGPLDPGESASLRLHEAGRHRFALAQSNATLVLTLLPDAPREATAFLVDEQGSPRFVPGHVRAAPGARVTLLNQAREPLALHRVAYEPWVALGGAVLDFTPVDEGLYTVVAEAADDAGRQGEARGRFLVDYDRPPAARGLGPLEGGFLGAPTPAEPHVHPFDAEYPVATLRLWGNASSALDGPATVHVALLRDDETLARATLAPEGLATLALADLPPGRYKIRVEPGEGHLLRYEIEGHLAYRLPFPERLREG